MPRKDLELDLASLQKFITKTASKNRIMLKEALADPRFAQIGVNLFRDTTDNCFWQVHEGDDGAYIIRAEPDEGMVAESADDQDWSAHADSTKETITLSHRGMPICRFAGKDFGFDKNTAETFRKFILEKVQDTEFVKKLYAWITGK